MSSAGKIEWFDIPVTEFSKAKAFYGELVGWKIQPMEDQYQLIQVGDNMIGGLRKTSKVEVGQESTVLYINVENLSDAITRAKNLGAPLIGDVVKVDDNGSFQLFKDPDGNIHALWENIQ